MTTIAPMLSYEDVGAAIEWLSSAFGFTERERFQDDDGRVGHAVLTYEGAELHLGWPSPHYRGPRRHAETCDDARRWLDNPYVVDGVLVEVADLDEHLRRAQAAGAEIIRGPESQPFGRLYTAADPEGHRWMFSQRA